MYPSGTQKTVDMPRMSRNINMEKATVLWDALLDSEGLGVVDERADDIADAQEHYLSHWLPIFDPTTGRLAEGCRRRGFVKID